MKREMRAGHRCDENEADYLARVRVIARPPFSLKFETRKLKAESWNVKPKSRKSVWTRTTTPIWRAFVW